MLARIGVALMLSSSLFACTSNGPSQDEVREQIEACGGNELCSVASLTASHLNKQVGKSFGGGVSLREVTTDGKTLSAGLNVPASIANEPVRNGLNIQQQVAKAFRDGMCGNKDTEQFFSLGGEVILRTYLLSGEVFSEHTIRSCHS